LLLLPPSFLSFLSFLSLLHALVKDQFPVGASIPSGFFTPAVARLEFVESAQREKEAVPGPENEIACKPGSGSVVGRCISRTSHDESEAEGCRLLLFLATASQLWSSLVSPVHKVEEDLFPLEKSG
jgi:hypothetical protein